MGLALATLERLVVLGGVADARGIEKPALVVVCGVAKDLVLEGPAGAVVVSPNPSPNPGRARARHQYAAVGTRSMASPTEVDETELGARI